MLYFFHHYELPLILQQAQLQEFIIRAQSPENEDTIEPLSDVDPEIPPIVNQVIPANIIAPEADEGPFTDELRSMVNNNFPGPGTGPVSI